MSNIRDNGQISAIAPEIKHQVLLPLFHVEAVETQNVPADMLTQLLSDLRDDDD